MTEEVLPGRKIRTYQPKYWAQKEIERVLNWDPLDTPAAWMTHEISEALDAIQGPHERRKRTTVLRVAEAMASDLPIQPIFKNPETCNQSTWYRIWLNDEAITNALELAKRRAHWWYDREEAARIALRQRQVSHTQDEIVDLTNLATETLAHLMLNAESEKIRLEAAETILDRADEATSRKSVTEHGINVVHRQGPSMSEIGRRVRQRDGIIMAQPQLASGAPPPPPTSVDDIDDEDIEWVEEEFEDTEEEVETEEE